MPSQSSGSSNPFGRVARACVLTLAALICLHPALPVATADARGGYAGWLKHGDSYAVTGTIAGRSGTVRVHIKWRGNRFVVQTPMGTYPLKRAGSAVRFRVYFDKAWASVTWAGSRATVVFRGERATARVRKLQGTQSAQFRNKKIR